MPDAKKTIDWGGIERDYTKGDWSIREIGRWYQVSDAAIRKRAKAGNWVRAECEPKKCEPAGGEAAPTLMAGVDATKPENIVARGQNLVFALLSELEAASSNATALEELIDMHEEDPRRKAAMLSAVSLKGRSDVIKALATAFKTWTESKPGQPEGKKAEKDAAAAGVVQNTKFAPRGGPKLAVVKG